MPAPAATRSRFAAVPIETTFDSVRRSSGSSQPPGRPGPDLALTPAPSPHSLSPAAPPQRTERRRYAPQLIETSRRARRACDAGPATKPTDKTDVTPYTNHIYAAKPRLRRKRGDSAAGESIRHLPCTRRESEDEAVKQYFLELAARQAARQLQEAALAAFPNSRAREGGVAHFYYSRSSSSENTDDGLPSPSQAQAPAQTRVAASRARRKSSSPDLSWWHKQMQDHAEQIARQRVSDEVAVLDEDASSQMDIDSVNGQDPFTRQDPLQNGNAGRPFEAFGMQPDDAKLSLLRKTASPPMLGKDLSFRTCPSPKQTKLETDHPFSQHVASREKNRDVSGKGGLWQGFCCRSESNTGYTVPADLRPADLIVTPLASDMSQDLSASESFALSEEPSSTSSASSSTPPTSEHRPKSGQAKGLHMLHGLDERLRKEKAQAERKEKILQEFDDDFVTQVFNYLSLGYPAMARCFDEEISKISGVSVDELCQDDDQQLARGYIADKDQDVARCPRWRALKKYILEWASQNPDLDNLVPLAWGVGERRGSWAF